MQFPIFVSNTYTGNYWSVGSNQEPVNYYKDPHYTQELPIFKIKDWYMDIVEGHVPPKAFVSQSTTSSRSCASAYGEEGTNMRPEIDVQLSSLQMEYEIQSAREQVLDDGNWGLPPRAEVVEDVLISREISKDVPSVPQSVLDNTSIEGKSFVDDSTLGKSSEKPVVDAKVMDNEVISRTSPEEAQGDLVTTVADRRDITPVMMSSAPNFNRSTAAVWPSSSSPRPCSPTAMV